MNYDLNEEQNLLKDSARKFLADECPSAFVRQMTGDEKGFTPDIWKKMADLGWLGLPFPEAYGGAGMDFLHLAVLLAEMGYAGLPGPFFSTVVLGGLAVLEAGSEAQKQSILPELCAGNRLLTLAWLEEDGAGTPDGMRLRADARGDHYILSGVKLFVPDARVADTIVCAARTDASGPGVSLFLVDASNPGITVTPLDTFAGDKQCEVALDRVAVPRSDLLGKAGEGWPVLERALLLAAVAKCAEMTGGARRVLEMAVGYTKERVQFGRPIGAFQAVQHHCANMLTYADTIQFMTCHAAWRIAAGLAFETEASMCKAWVSDAYRKLVALGHQVMGGIGFMEEHDLHLYFKRAKAAELLFGDADFHRERVARDLGL